VIFSCAKAGDRYEAVRSRVGRGKKFGGHCLGEQALRGRYLDSGSSLGSGRMGFEKAHRVRDVQVHVRRKGFRFLVKWKGLFTQESPTQRRSRLVYSSSLGLIPHRAGSLARSPV